jgi:hypothetical protein
VLVHTAWSELSTRRISLPVARYLVVLHRFSSLLLMRILQLDDLMALTTVRLLRILNTLVALDQVLLLTVK